MTIKLPICGCEVLLRDFILFDIPAIARIAGSLDERFNTLVPPDSSEEKIQCIAASFVRWAMDSQKADPVTHIRENFRLAITKITAPKKVVGYISLDKGDEQKQYIGYFVDPRMQRRGIASDAGAALLNGVFGAMSCDLIYAAVHPENEPSRKVLRNLGYEEIGTTTSEIRGVIEPRIILSVDWEGFCAAQAPVRDIVKMQRWQSKLILGRQLD